jgi:hypothetical protein
MHPFDGGIIRRLRELEVRFDPLVAITQSANNVSSIINRNINGDGYVSLGRGGAVIELFFAEEIELNALIILAGKTARPRCFTVTCVTETGESHLLADVVDAPLQEPLSRMQVDFEVTRAKIFRINQTSPNWDGRHSFRVRKIECFSPDPRYQSGFFRCLFKNHRSEIDRFVRVSARFNQPDQLYRLDDTFNCYINDAPDQSHWIQVLFTKGNLMISGYALRRRIRMELRSWSLVGADDPSVPLEDWTELHHMNETVRGDHDIVEYFPIQSDRTFSCFRLLNHGPRWDGLPRLHLDGFELFGIHEGRSATSSRR